MHLQKILYRILQESNKFNSIVVLGLSSSIIANKKC
jgi:hypothetical protein